jgi:hypothetical protein
MGTHRFTSVVEALKFFGSNVRGILLGGLGVGVRVRVEVEVESVALAVGTVVGISLVGAAVTSEPLHPAASAHRHTPEATDVTTNRFPSTGAMLAA